MRSILPKASLEDVAPMHVQTITRSPARAAGVAAIACGIAIALFVSAPTIAAVIAGIPDAARWVIDAFSASGRGGLLYFAIVVVVCGFAAYKPSRDNWVFAGCLAAAGTIAAFVAFWMDWSFTTAFIVCAFLAFIGAMPVVGASVASDSATPAAPTTASSPVAAPLPPPRRDHVAARVVEAFDGAELTQEQWEALQALRDRDR
jgi:hypothetical protein